MCFNFKREQIIFAKVPFPTPGPPISEKIISCVRNKAVVSKIGAQIRARQEVKRSALDDVAVIK
jgi:hypothetical protein